MWQSRTSNIPMSALNTFKRHSRLIHFCHTPLLFLPSWRLQSAATRDHSLTPPQMSHFNLNSSAHQQPPQLIQSKQESTNAIMIKWHQELCKSILSEYKQYLQTLGFNPIQVESQKKFVFIIEHCFDFTLFVSQKCSILLTHLLCSLQRRAAAILLSQKIDVGRYFIV